MGSIFEALGRQAGKAMKKGQWIYRSVFGTEEEAIEAEQILGQELDHQLRSQSQLLDDEVLQNKIQEMGSELSACLGDNKRQFRFNIVRSHEINAFALPGGYIYFTSGLIKAGKFKTAEIAFIMAHEIGHVVRGHPFDRVLAQSSIGFISKITRAGGALGRLAQPVLMKLLRSNYSQTQELDADLFAVQLMSAAGYDPEFGASSLDRLRQLNKEAPKLFNYFSTHPEIEERIREVNFYRRKYWKN